jgi:hypothetical protein
MKEQKYIFIYLSAETIICFYTAILARTKMTKFSCTVTLIDVISKGAFAIQFGTTGFAFKTISYAAVDVFTITIAIV